MRLLVMGNMTGPILCEHVHQFTQPGAQVYTDESESYHQLKRAHATVCHAIKQWARDDDGDGIRKVHTRDVGRGENISASMRVEFISAISVATLLSVSWLSI